MGNRYREADIDVQRILRDFDRLYPLYEYVESQSQHLSNSTALPEEVLQGMGYSEGGVQSILVNRYERDPRARKMCIEHYGTTCAVCKFDFGDTYGEIAKGFIHVHHLKQLSEVGPDYVVNPIADLRPLCPNCHAVAHRKVPALSIDALQSLLKSH